MTSRNIAAFSLVALVACASASLLRQASPGAFAPLQEKEMSQGDPDDPQARDQWFWEQRTYPKRTIPVDVHRAAIVQELERGKQSRRAEQASAMAWTELGPSSLSGVTMGGSRQDASGRALTVAIHPTNSNIVLVGTAQGGIWRSTDAGTSFKPVSEDQPSLAVKAIRFAASNPSVVYAGTGEPHSSTSIFGAGLLKSTDAGQTWRALPLSGSGWSFQYTAISGVQVDPANPDIVYATSAIVSPAVDAFNPPTNSRPPAGLFKSTDGGQSWTRQLTATAYGGRRNLGFIDLEMGSSALLYASELGGGIYKTTDGGANWARVTPWKSETAGGALPAPVASFSHYVESNGRFSLYNRLPLLDTTPDFGRIEMGISAADPNILYAGYEMSSMALDVNGNGTYDEDSDIVTAVGLLFKSADGGQNWEWLGDWGRNGAPQYCGSQCGYDNTVVVNPSNAADVIVGGSANYTRLWPDPPDNPKRLVALPWRGMISRSLDGGRSWLDATPHCNTTNYVDYEETYGTPPLPVVGCPTGANDPLRVIHPDIHNAAFEPGTGRIYVAHDGGLSRARLADGGSAASSQDYRWDNLNAGLATLQFYSFDVHPTDPSIMLGGLQDNAMAYYNGQPQWDGWGQGDGTIGAFDPQDPKIVYYGAQYSVYRHNNGGAKSFADRGWVGVVTRNMFANESVAFVPVFKVDPVQPNIIYAATTAGVYLSDNRGGSGGPSNWVRMGDIAGATSISVSPKNNNHVWIGTRSGKVFLFNVASQTLVEKTAAPLPGRYVSKIEASPREASTVFVSFSGYNGNTPSAPGKVFRSANLGEDWTDISGNLPDVPVSAMALDPGNAGRMWVGSDIGAFVTTDGGASWASWRLNMPVVAIMDMKYNATTGFLNLVTHGRGAWRINPDAAPSTPSSMYFPRLVNNASQLTGVAVVNTTSQPAQLNFTAYTNSGTRLSGSGLTNPQSRALNARNQTGQIASQIFGPALDVSGGWVKVSSTISGLTGFFLSLDPALTTMDGVDVSDRLLTEFLLGEAQNAEISLVNPSETQSAAVTLRFVSNEGQESAGQTVSIPSNGRFANTAANLFPPAVLTAGGYISVTSTAGLAGTELFGVPNTYAASLNPIDTAGGAQLLYSPQYVVGGGTWKTTLTLINLENAATTVTLNLVGDNGTPIGRAASLSLPPRGRTVVSDPGLLGVSASGALVQGYVRVSSSATRIAGYVRFGDPNDAQFQTALPFETQGRSEVVFSQVAQNETFFTGVAIINTDAQAAAVSVAVFNPDGVQVGAGSLTIQPNARISQLLPQIIPGLPALGGGYFRVSSNRPVFSFAVFGTNTLSVLAAVPPQGNR